MTYRLETIKDPQNPKTPMMQTYSFQIKVIIMQDKAIEQSHSRSFMLQINPAYVRMPGQACNQHAT